jgi:REP element-mobilizing transposase RayT
VTFHLADSLPQTALLRLEAECKTLSVEKRDVELRKRVEPNHVHTLFQPIDGWTVAKIVAAWKKFTARKICDSWRESGEVSVAPVWHREYWDRFIRDQRHFEEVIEYIHLNPVKAGLVPAAEKWPWSSAYPGNAGILDKVNKL